MTTLTKWYNNFVLPRARAAGYGGTPYLHTFGAGFRDGWTGTVVRAADSDGAGVPHRLLQRCRRRACDEGKDHLTRIPDVVTSGV